MTDQSPTDTGSTDGQTTEATTITRELGPNELPSEAIVRATAALKNIPVIDLSPLYDVVHPDHLDGVFGDRGESPALDEGHVTFTFNGCQVTVTEASVVVRPNDHAPE